MLRIATAVVFCSAWAGSAAADALPQPVERRLHADQVTASSFLWNDWNRFQENYHPLYVSDDDPKTAWVEGVEGEGVGEWIRLHVTEMEGATQLRLRVRNGYQKSATLFAANARPKEITIKLLPSGTTKKVTLADAQGWQDVVVAQPAGKLEAVELRIESAYPGSKYTDNCISDLQLFATAATRENPAFEKSKLDKILAWKSERLQAAQLFKKSARDLPLLPSYRFAATGESEYGDLWDSCGANDLCWMQKALDKAGKNETFRTAHAAALAIAAAGVSGKDYVAARLAPTDTRPVPAVDGLAVPSPWAGIARDFGNDAMELPLINNVAALRAEQLGALQLEGADGKITRDQVLGAKAPGCKTKKGRTYSWLLRDKAPEGSADAGRERLRALFLVRCNRVEVREGTEDSSVAQVAVYDGDGRLELVVGPGYVNAFRWTTNSGRPLLAGGTAIYVDGRSAELTAPEIARTP